MSAPLPESGLSTDLRNSLAWIASDRPFRLLVDSVRDYAIFLLDPSGHIVSWNTGAEHIKGYQAQEIIGQHVSRFYTEDALKNNWPQHELDMAQRTGHFEDQGWRVRKDGSRFWASVMISAIRDGEGNLLGYSKITRDLTERKRHEDALKESEERFRLLVEGVRDYAIFMLDPEGRVSSWNAGAARIKGYRAEEVIGTSFSRFYPEEDVLAGKPARVLRDASEHGRAEDHGWRVRKDGSRFWAHVIVTALHDQSGELRGFAKVTRDLSERKRLESLEEEGRNVTEFLAMLAHELRNPLAPMRNAAAILRMTPDDPEQVAWCQGIIERQATLLTRLVDDLLDVSRITSGKIQIDSAAMDLNKAVEDAVQGERMLAEARRQHLQVVLATQPAKVHGDLTRLTQVVLNLVHNAIKYTPEGGTITVEVKSEGSVASIVVSDTGIGIAPSMRENIFELFMQGGRSLDRAEGGLGIGLTLARRIVEMHGGTLTAASDGPGRGSQFTVTLPVLKQVGFLKTPNVHGGRHAVATQQSVLVVDDNIDSAQTTGVLLRALGHHVTILHDGLAAVAHIVSKLPDVLLLDIGLPGLDGYAVAEKLRTLPGGDKVRLYAMTGYGHEDDRRRTAEAGFDGHLVKPLLPEELIAVMSAG